ncbi:MAG TPA: hypothetical protein PLR07_09860 [Promineifilum sp.]|nr:hypothetical protein [Promineifilum sp.]
MFTSSEIARVLRRKFEFEDVKGKKKEIYLSLKLPGVEPVITHVSHPKSNRTTVGKVLESMMARQLRVETPYFKGMIQCTNSRDDYYRRLEEDSRASP